MLRALVRVEEAPALPWRAELQYQDQDYAWHSPFTAIDLVPGAWVEVMSEFPPGSTLSAARAWGLQVASDDVGDLKSVTFTIDELGQGARGTPLSPAQAWETITNRLVTDLREEQDDDTLLLVPGYTYSKVQTWRENHPAAWIHDPANHLRYEAHHYWDITEEGVYRHSYEEGVKAAAAEGF